MLPELMELEPDKKSEETLSRECRLKKQENVLFRKYVQLDEKSVNSVKKNS